MWTPEAWYGGAKFVGALVADYEIVDRHIRAWAFGTTTPGLSIFLPPATRLYTGFGNYYLSNESGAESLAIKTNSGAITVVTLGPNARAILSLFDKDDADGTWWAKT